MRTWWRRSPLPLAEAGAREPSLERRIAALAFPALGVLAAEPLYLLFDLAVVGRLGALSLAGLAIGGLIVSLVGSQLTFLSTATTARSARFYGVGDRKSAVAEGVQATWLAIGLYLKGPYLLGVIGLSLLLDPGGLDHARPFDCLVGDQLGEFLRRADGLLLAQPRVVLLH